MGADLNTRAWALALLLAAGLLLPGAAASADAPGPEHLPGFYSPYVASPGPQIPSTELNHPYGGAHELEGRRDFLERVHASGVRWVYIWVSWSDIEIAPGVYRWDNIDRFLTTAEDVGIHIIVQVQTGAWSTPQPWAGPMRTNSRHPGYPTAAYEDFGPARDFYVALVERYRPGGVLAQAQGWTDYGVRIWEVENEPDQTIMPYHSWATVPKDYAAFLAEIGPAMKAVDPGAVIAAPALNHEEEPNPARGGGLASTAWLDKVLSAGSPESEWASDTYRAADEHPGGGPFVDLYSFHRNNVNLADGQIPKRIADVRAVIERHADDPTYPTTRDPALYYSEGNALSYDPDPILYARAQAQLAVLMLGGGVQRIAFDHGSHINAADWESHPMFKASRTITSLFPVPGDVRLADDLFDADRVTAYVREAAGAPKTTVLWAKNHPQGSGQAPGERFTVRVPVTTAKADVVGPDWEQRRVDAVDGAVEVELWADDPSPVVFVTEVTPTARGRRGAAGADPRDEAGAAGRGPGAGSGPAATQPVLPATGGGLFVGAASCCLAGAALRRWIGAGSVRA